VFLGESVLARFKREGDFSPPFFEFRPISLVNNMAHGKKEILVLGVGNLLLRDEGVGVHVVQRLQDMELPPNVEVVDGGTGGFDLIDYIADRKKVIVIDTVKAGEAPGTLYRFDAKDIETTPKRSLSLHDIDLADMLWLADMMGKKPEDMTVIGVEPKSMEMGLELSKEVEHQIPKIVELVVMELHP